jgi:hypothetical protein
MNKGCVMGDMKPEMCDSAAFLVIESRSDISYLISRIDHRIRVGQAGLKVASQRFTAFFNSP